MQGTFLFSIPLWALGVTSFVCRIGWEWFPSWVHQLWKLFGGKKWNEWVQKGAYFNVFLGQHFGGKNKRIKRRIFTRHRDFVSFPYLIDRPQKMLTNNTFFASKWIINKWNIIQWMLICFNCRLWRFSWDFDVEICTSWHRAGPSFPRE